MSSYVTLAQLREAVGIDVSTDTTDDARLRTVTFQASALVDEYLRSIRPGYVGFASSSNTHGAVGSNTRFYDGTGSDTLFIDDAASVASVVVDDATIATTDYIAWPYNEIAKRALLYVLPSTSLRGLTASLWSTGTANVEVTAYFGLPFVPQDVYETTMALAIILWRRQQKGDYAGSAQTLNSQRFNSGAGRQFQFVVDPEIQACLSQLDAGWAIGGVWGG